MARRLSFTDPTNLVGRPSVTRTRETSTEVRPASFSPGTGRAGRPSVVDPYSVVRRSSVQVARETLDPRLSRVSLEFGRVFEEERQREHERIETSREAERTGQPPPELPAGERIVEAHEWDISRFRQEFGTHIDSSDPRKSRGLTAEIVEQRQQEEGLNVLSPVAYEPLWMKFLKQFVQFFPLLLELGGIASLLAYALDPDADENLYLGIILLVVVLITAIFSFMQEAKSASIMEGFVNMNPDRATVVRDGMRQDVEAAQVVRGDIVFIKAGDSIPADLRLLWTDKLKVDNSSLTGENEAVTRTAEKTNDSHLETQNLAFSSSLVAEGEAVGVVYAIGDEAEIGHIANLAGKTEQEDTPLRKEIRRFMKIVSVVAIVLGLIFLVIALAVLEPIEEQWVFAVVFGIGIIVANVPEGLLPTLTVALTVTAKKLARRNVLVKNLEAVETLGSCSTICSDKTGTLTLNQMTVVACYYDGQVWAADRSTISSGTVDPESQPSYRMLRTLATLNNKVDFDRTTEGNMELPPRDRVCLGGNASEIALIRLVAVDEDKPDVVDLLAFRNAFPVLYEIPFNSDNKWQLSIHQQPDDLESTLAEIAKVESGVPTGNTEAGTETGTEAETEAEVETGTETETKTETEAETKRKRKRSSSKPFLLTVKGAPERVLAMCSGLLENGETRLMTDADRVAIEDANAQLASTGRRVLGFAMLELSQEVYPEMYERGYEFAQENLPLDSLTFVGLTGLMDPPRPEVPQAIEDCRTAGVRVIMVTGDHPLTAEAIARDVGIIRGDTPEEVARRLNKSVSSVTIAEAPAIVVKGSDISNLGLDAWNAILERREIVFARTSPEQKLQIVSQCQERGEIIAVTGDGVNDSPALRKADLGCAMGITGTAVAKEAADVVLMDDNFASIVEGVRRGRIIFDNLKKSIMYTLSSNFTELIPFIVFITTGLPLALSVILILLIDLGTDMIPAISLAYEKPESNIMERPPRNPETDRLVTLKLAIFSYLWLGVIQAAAGYLGFFIVMTDFDFDILELFGSRDFFSRNNDVPMCLDPEDGSFFEATATEICPPGQVFLDQDAQLEILEEAQTAFFVGVVITRMGCVILAKTRTLSLFQHGLFNNRWLLFGLGFAVLLAIAITYLPFLNTIFATEPIDYELWFFFLPFAVGLIAIDELRKYFIRNHPHNRVVKWVAW